MALDGDTGRRFFHMITIPLVANFRASFVRKATLVALPPQRRTKLLAIKVWQYRVADRPYLGVGVYASERERKRWRAYLAGVLRSVSQGQHRAPAKTLIVG